MSVYHSLCGFVLKANVAIPGLPGMEAYTPDILVEVVEDERGELFSGFEWTQADPLFLIWKAHTAEGTYYKLRYADGLGSLEYVLHPSGERVWVWYSGSATLLDATALLTGSIFGCLLQLRGVTCLHSSVVSVDGRAIAFTGPEGAGKSTTARSLLDRGALVAADDIAALVAQTSGFAVRNFGSRLRLTPETANAFGSYEDLAPLWSDGENRPLKRHIDGAGPGSTPPAEIPLAAIYLLEPRDSSLKATRFEALSPAEAVPKLMTNRYASYVQDRAAQARDFFLLGRVAASVPVRLMHRPDALDNLPEVSEAILRDLRGLIHDRNL